MPQCAEPGSGALPGASLRAAGGGGAARVLVAAGAAVAAAAGAALVGRVVFGAVRRTPPRPKKDPRAVVFGRQFGAEVGTEDAMETRFVADDYFWMRDDERKDGEVLRHLREENAFTNFRTLGMRGLAKGVYKEILGHVQETDESVPAKRGPWEYYVRTVEGSSYSFHCRRPVGGGEEEVLLDENEIAKGKAHCSFAAVEVSPSHDLLAYAVDFAGDETYGVYCLELGTRAPLAADFIAETNGAVEWGSDNSTLYYGTMDKAHRSYKVWLHEMRGVAAGADTDTCADDVCLFTEEDEVYSLYLAKSLSGRFMFLTSYASTTTEVRYVDLHASPSEVHLVAEREEDVLYHADHAGGDRLLLTTNADGATNFKVVECAVGADRASWTDFLPYVPERNVIETMSFESFVVVGGREGGFSALWVLPAGNPDDMFRIPVDEESCVVDLARNWEFKTDKLRYVYSSMTTPKKTYDFDVSKRERTLLKETPVPNYDRSLYRTERLVTTSADGTEIPMSLVWNAAAVGDTGEPGLLHLYGYGSYGSSMDPSFSASILPLLDRGIVYAIAHVRGGGEGGRAWYESARFETKPKTFSDFVSCAEMLIASGRTTPAQLSMEGRSAGGLLMGAVMNARPDLFRAVLAGVPFVDVLNTMSDATIPLTTGEWLEWGNPHEEKYFHAIWSYCPYQNVGQKPYPAVLVTTGLYDPRVLYSEPAKWVSKLRAHTTSGREILLKVDMDAGHFSASDRYKSIREKAFEYAWLLRQLGAPDTPC